MSEKWDESRVPDQSGRVAVVTGGNGGLGLATCRALARAGAHVVMAARDLDKAERAVRTVAADAGRGTVEVVSLDLADLSSVAAASAAILDRHPHLDLLVNNAGIMGPPFAETAQGIEIQLGTNHIGHFALTADLLPALARVPGSRVVTVTSVARFRTSPIDGDADHGPDGYREWHAYGRSKLANHLFALELHHRLRAAAAPTASLSAHPGLTHSDLQRTSAADAEDDRAHRGVQVLAEEVGMTVEEGVLPQLRAATDPMARSGELYAPRYALTGPPVRRPLLDPRAASRRRVLWRRSEELIGRSVDVAALVRRHD